MAPKHTHTPGPWIVDDSHSFEWDGLQVWANDVVIANVVDDQHMNAANNARLIAAAPRMAALLKDMLACMAANDGDSLANAANAASEVLKDIGVIEAEPTPA